MGYVLFRVLGGVLGGVLIASFPVANNVYDKRFKILCEGVEESDITKVQKAVVLGLCTSPRDSTEKKAYCELFHLAIQKGDFDIASLLLENSTIVNDQVNFEDGQGNTSLHLAIQRGDWKVVFLLLQKDANLNAKDRNNNTPLHLAVRPEYKNIKVINLLLGNKAVNVNARTVWDTWSRDKRDMKLKGLTPLYLAVDFEDFEVVTILLNAGANPNDKFCLTNGETTFILHLAVQKNNLKVIEALINNKSHEIDFNVQDENGCTPLHLAVKNRKPQIVLCFFERGAQGKKNANSPSGGNINVNIQDKNQFTAIDYAIRNKDYNIIQVLVVNGADFSRRNREQRNLVERAVFNNDFRLLQILLQYPGVDVNTQDQQQRTPLHRAILRQDELQQSLDDGNKQRDLDTNIDIINILLQHQANVNLQDLENFTPLDYATQKEQRNSIRALLQNGKGISDETKQKALRIAVENRYSTIVAIFLENGVRPNSEILGQILLNALQTEQ